ncbi:RNA-directed DNA polymerase [Deinococcus antarcticus]|uniref:RNA-directed DNA polymerase n=1 Tax=Deinococcus antarcticus TaxID=1298767 RepID=A0ABV8AEK3_9DEIO
MRVTKQSLNQVIDDEFWKAVTLDSGFMDVHQFKDINKSELIDMISEKLFDHSYSFKNPIEIFSPKSMGILRKKELFHIDDVCIYYYCVKLIQDQIIETIKLNKNVFGAFRMTKELSYRNIKSSKAPTIEKSDDADDEISDYESVLAKDAFKKDWNEFQDVAEELFDKEYDLYINLDVAHFYNDINLDVLERQVRAVTQGKSDIVDLLFYLLRNYRKGEYGFYQSGRSLPQNDIGEMSRLLANLYLSVFDTAVVGRLNKLLKEDQYEYTRYSDDLWIAIKGDKDTAFKVIQIVSFELSRVELFINEGKMKILTRSEFGEYWCFEVWKKIFELKNKPESKQSDWMEIVDITVKMSSNKKTSDYRWFSPQLYALKVISSFPQPEKFFNSANKAAKILNIILGAERNLEKSNSSIINLVFLLIKKYPHFRSKIDKLIGGSIYPSMEYFAIKISIGLDGPNKNMETFERYSKMYLSSYANKWQWYSRCLILRFVADHASLIDGVDLNQTSRGIDSDNITEKIIKQFENNRHNTNYIERRYQIYFLKRFSNIIGRDRIESNIEGYFEKSLWRALNTPRVN